MVLTTRCKNVRTRIGPKRVQSKGSKALVPLLSPVKFQLAMLTLNRLGTVAELQDVEPEYARIPAICRMFGVSRPFIFESFHRGVKSLHIKKPGSSKGIRLVKVASMREYLEGFSG
jgi:hypothetical protein